jgi:thioredoxin-related protein
MNMKSSLLPFLSLFVTFAAQAAPPPGWTSDYEKAVEKAKAEHKDLLLDFTGSDWCGFCMALDKEVFKTPQFHNWAKKYVVLVEVDFPHNTPLSDKVKSQNDGLQQKYQTRGFPTILVTDPDGKELARKVGYHPGSGPATYISALETDMKKAGPLPAATGEPSGSSAEPSIFKSPPATGPAK